MRSGKAEKYPYSLSRWTEVPGGKWGWFRQRLVEGSFLGFDPTTGMPGRWSLAPEEVLGLLFWTKDPRNLLKDRDILLPFNSAVHFTITGWYEVETGVPSLTSSLDLLPDLLSAYGPSNVIIRYSPIPQQKEALVRWTKLAEALLNLGVKEVYVSSLRYGFEDSKEVSLDHAVSFLKETSRKIGLKLLGCKDDVPLGLDQVACESGERFSLDLKKDACGCAKVVDPFTRSEACVFHCKYCYATGHGKKNTTARAI